MLEVACDVFECNRAPANIHKTCEGLRLEMGGPKTIKQTKSGFDQKDQGQAEKQAKMRKYIAKLAKLSQEVMKSTLWGACGDPDG